MASTLETPERLATRYGAFKQGEGLAPGLFLVALVTAAAFGLHVFVPAVSLGLIAVGIGLTVGNAVTLPARALPGIAFAMRKMLRFSVMLLGLQISVGQVASLGADVVATVILTLIATLLATIMMGRLLGVDPKLARLLAAGTAICGASAVLATNEVVDGNEKDAAYAVCMVTIFGTIALFLFPVLGEAARLTGPQFGLWSGAAIHEVAQAVGAAFQFGDLSGKVGTVAKLTRVLCLAPVMLAFVRFPVEPQTVGKRASTFRVPWFVVGFLAMVALNSIIPLQQAALDAAKTVTLVLLAAALGAMGLETKFHALWRRGWRPLVLATFAFAFIAATAFCVIVLRF